MNYEELSIELLEDMKEIKKWSIKEGKKIFNISLLGCIVIVVFLVIKDIMGISVLSLDVLSTCIIVNITLDNFRKYSKDKSESQHEITMIEFYIEKKKGNDPFNGL